MVCSPAIRAGRSGAFASSSSIRNERTIWHGLTGAEAMQEDASPVEASSDIRGWQERAKEHFARGEFRSSHAAALEGLSANPDDLDGLRLAGRAGVEIGADDAVAQLQRAAELAPDQVESWRDLGDALAADGRTAEAEEAWKKLAALRPDDSMVLTSLGHAALAAAQPAKPPRRPGASMVSTPLGHAALAAARPARPPSGSRPPPRPTRATSARRSASST